MAEVTNFDATHYLGEKGLRNFDRLTKFLIVAAKLALEDAGLKKDGKHVALDPSRVGVCSSTAYGSLEAITELKLVAELEDPRYINPARFPNTVINAAAGYVSIWEDLRAPNVTVVDGNCGALDAMLTADTHLSHRRGDAFLVGGAEVLSEALFVALQKLGALATTDPREPLSLAEGLRLGEGAAFVCMEAMEVARSRGANVLAEIAGYGTAFEPPESEALLVHASARSVARAIRGALADAGMDASQIDAVSSAHGGITAIDTAEMEGIREVFGDEVAVLAPKALVGETFGAGGAIGLVTAIGWLSGIRAEPVIAGTPHTDFQSVVVLTVGYYGNVSAVILKRRGTNVGS